MATLKEKKPHKVSLIPSAQGRVRTGCGLRVGVFFFVCWFILVVFFKYHLMKEESDRWSPE